MKEKNRQWWLGAVAVCLVLGSCVINIKNIFTSCHADAEYQVAMAYRMVRGDHMFSEMWELHQTSAFVLAFFEWLYLKLVGTTTGIMVYANTVGVLCKTAVSFCVFATLRRFWDKRATFWVLLLLLNIYPKDIVLPDFANQQIWFALLLMCCLIRYLAGEQKPVWLVLGAVCLCLEVLSYPGCAVVWLGCAVLIGKYSGRKRRDQLVFTGVCAAAGGVYVLWFMRGEPQRFLQQVYEICSGDASHAVGLGERLRLIGQDVLALGTDMGRYAVMALVALLIVAIYGYASKKKGTERTARQLWLAGFSCFVWIYVLWYLVRLPAEQAGTKYRFFALYLFVELAAFMCIHALNETEKKIFWIGQLIGFGGFAATVLLSDCGLFTSIPYMIPNLCVCLPALEKVYAEERAGLRRKASAYGLFAPMLLFCAVMLFRNGIYVNGWMNVPANFREDSVFGIDWTAAQGPLKGIKSREGTYVADISYAEWQELVKPQDRVLILSYPVFTATAYLYQDVEISGDSVISTPTYSDRQLRYWEENPDKYPNVVAVKCYNGELMAGEDNPLLQWLENDFQPERIVDGTFWRFYLKNDAR